MNSSRTGCTSPAGKTSAMPPRIANSPCSSAGSSREKPASTSSSARSIGEMSCPGFKSSAAVSICSGDATRGSSAAADAITTRAVPRATACSARARTEVTPKCGARPRYGSTSCDGNGSTARSVPPASALRARDEETTHRRTSPRDRRRSARRRGSTPVGCAWRAAATYNAFAGRREARDRRRSEHPSRCG